VKSFEKPCPYSNNMTVSAPLISRNFAPALMRGWGPLIVVRESMVKTFMPGMLNGLDSHKAKRKVVNRKAG